MSAEDYEAMLYCDFHGHSVKKNVFIYGCSDSDSKRNAFIKLIPLLMQQTNKLFSFPDCHFRIEKEKEATARVVAFREVGILNSYTIEGSFCGPASHSALESDSDSSGVPYMTPTHFGSIGRDLCLTLLMLISPKIFRRKLSDLASGVQKPIGTEAETESTERFTLATALREIEAEETLAEQLQQTSEGVGSNSDTSGDEQQEVKPAKEVTARKPMSASPAKLRVKKVAVRPVTSKPGSNRLPPRPQTSIRHSVRALDESVVSNPQPASIDTASSLNLDVMQQQVSRIYTMLRYYKEAGGKLQRLGNSSLVPQVRVDTEQRRRNPTQLRIRTGSTARSQSVRQRSLVKPKSRETEEPSYRFLERCRRSHPKPA